MVRAQEGGAGRSERDRVAYVLQAAPPRLVVLTEQFHVGVMVHPLRPLEAILSFSAGIPYY